MGLAINIVASGDVGIYTLHGYLSFGAVVN